MPRVTAIIAAAGSGTRLTRADGVPKQWRPLGGEPLIRYAFTFFDTLDAVESIVVSLDAASLERPERRAALESGRGKRVRLVAGGSHRQESVWRALQAVDPGTDIVLIHDGARPFPPRDAVLRSIATAGEKGGAILAVPVLETIKRVDENMRILETPPRANLWAAQTPQTFRYEPLMDAYRKALENLESHTDDAGLFEAAGGYVQVVPGAIENIKVTLPQDFERAGRYLAEYHAALS